MIKKNPKSFLFALVPMCAVILSCGHKTVFVHRLGRFENPHTNVFFLFEFFLFFCMVVFFLVRRFNNTKRALSVLKKTKKMLLCEFEKKPYRENDVLKQKTICEVKNFFDCMFEKKFARIPKEKRALLIEETFSDMKNKSEESFEKNPFSETSNEEELETLEAVDESESGLEEVFPCPFSFTSFQNSGKKLEMLSPCDIISADENGVYSITNKEPLFALKKNRAFQKLVDSILKAKK